MRIGVMLRHLHEKGGIVVYSVNVLHSLLKLGTPHEFVILLGSEGDRGRFPGFAQAREEVLTEPNRLLWDQRAVPAAARRLGLDLVFNPKLSVPLFAPCKTVLTMHGLEQFAARRLFKASDRLYFQTAMPFFCRRADAIISMTETGKRDLQKYLRANPAKIRVIPESYNELCGVVSDPARLEAVRTQYGLPRDFILFVGGVTPLKNIPALLRALKLTKARGLPHKLVLVGFKRWRFDRDLALIGELGLRDDVIEPGFVRDEDIPAIYSLARCLVLPSFYEGFGIPILEAQACGCPVIVSNGGAMPEVAGPGGALLFDPTRPEELADALGRVLGDADTAERLRRAGVENVRKYSWDRTARSTIALFEDLVRG